jgi:hypothetical protein
MLKLKRSARNGGSGVDLKNLGFPVRISETLGFDGDIGSQADSKAGSVGEIDLEVRSIAAIFKDGAQTNDFPGEFFAFNHGFTCLDRTVSSRSVDFGAYHTHRV